jgi:Tfp pilus assembly protein PilO
MSHDFLTRHGARIATAGAVLGVTAYVALMFLPRRAELARMQGQIAERQATAAQASRTSEEMARAARELADAKRYVEVWTATAPPPEQLIAVFRDVNQLAQSAQTRNLRLEPAPVETLAAVWRAPVKLSVEGTFAQLFQFVRGVESLSPSICLAPLEMERVDGDGQTLRMAATLTIFGPGADFSNYANLAE